MLSHTGRLQTQARHSLLLIKTNLSEHHCAWLKYFRSVLVEAANVGRSMVTRSSVVRRAR